MKQCICIVCYKPSVTWLEFLSTFTHYDIFLIIDDNSVDYSALYTQYETVHCIQLPNEEVKVAGFRNINFTLNLEVTAWEKALYYFSTVNLIYDRIWFLEDDVYIFNENTIRNIDCIYPTSDLLSNIYTENLTGDLSVWQWHRIQILFSPPYYNAMVCACRISKPLLSAIRDYANTNGTLFFLEALFPTLCKKYKLLYDCPDELKTCVYRANYSISDVTINNVFHPVKLMDRHTKFRFWCQQYLNGLG